MQVVECGPYEAMAKAVVAWTRDNIDVCDVIHAHEWGGLLVDLATLDNYRQLKPGQSESTSRRTEPNNWGGENGVSSRMYAVSGEGGGGEEHSSCSLLSSSFPLPACPLSLFCVVYLGGGGGVLSGLGY
jgi:hypothetical protein